MSYSMCLMALVTSQIQQLQAEIKESLDSRLQQLAELVTSFFGPGSVPDHGLGFRAGSGRAST
jgi:hypothetical protein